MGRVVGSSPGAGKTVREREAEMTGDHTTSVDSRGEHLMVEGTESDSESLTRLASSEVDDQGRELV